MDSIKRDLKYTILKLLKSFPCVTLIGARQVGKSTLLRQVAPDAPFYDLEQNSHFEMIDGDPELFLKNKDELIVIDEAQLSGSLFSALRVKIDENRKKNSQFLISGSSSPELLKNISESLAGRVAIVEVPTLSWSEALGKKKSEFYHLLEKPEKFCNLKLNYDGHDLLKLCTYGLYPEPFLKLKYEEDSTTYNVWQNSYFRTYIDRDVRSLFPKLNLETYKRFIKMLSMSSGEILNYASYAKSLDISEPSIKNYMEIASGTFIWRNIPVYSNSMKKRLIKSPKGQMRDNILINFILKFNSVEDLMSHPNFGNIWESFVIEQLVKNLESNLIYGSYYYYRTHDGAEVDFILESKLGLIPIEIKSGSSTKKSQLKSLSNFIKEHNCPYGIVINLSEEVYQITESIYQVPASFI
ncbi:MAG: ATP-binding protein [Candidatus Caenarcaniphilales bacterium]|nr:ATP-binding protein [Candidatus Caenarcaniphilales bacterium]